MKKYDVEIVNTYFRLSPDDHVFLDFLIWRRDNEDVTSFNLDLDTENGKRLLKRLTEITGAVLSDLGSLTNRSFSVYYDDSGRMVDIGHSVDYSHYCSSCAASRN